MRCLTESVAHGRCVLQTHFNGQHINSRGQRFNAGRKKNPGVFYFYLNSVQAGELKAEAEARGTSPGMIAKAAVLKELGLEA